MILLIRSAGPDDDVCDAQRKMDQIRWAARCTAVCSWVNIFNSPCFSVMIPCFPYLFCHSQISPTVFQGAGTWGRRFLNCWTSAAAAWHLLLHTAEHEEVSLTACPFIVVVFWSSETSKTRDCWNNYTCLDSSLWHIQLPLTTGICILRCWPTRKESVSPLCIDTPPLLCCFVHIFPFFVSVFPCCSLWFELFNDRTVKLAGSRVLLRFENGVYVCL